MVEDVREATTTGPTGPAGPVGSAGHVVVPGVPADPAGVLTAVRAARAAEHAAAAAQLALAVQWAVLHEVSDLTDAAGYIRAPGGKGTALPLGGEGCPLVEEFCLSELAAVLGITTQTAGDLVGEALELCHRLPRIWARIHRGDLAPWRGRRIARATLHLIPAAARFVDAHLAPVAHRVGPVVVDRLIVEAETRFDPTAAAARRARDLEGTDPRGVVVDHRQVSTSGTSRIYGELDLADALDLDTALTTRARWVADLGCPDPLPVRRALALGHLARADLDLPLPASNPHLHDHDEQPVVQATEHAGEQAVEQAGQPLAPQVEHVGQGGQVGQGGRPGGLRRGGQRVGTRHVVLYLHLPAAAITTPHRSEDPGAVAVGRVENTGDLVTTDQIRAWCATPGTRITVTPVLDLADHLHTAAYEIPDRLTDQVRLRDLTCAFPYCERRAAACDTDHVHPHCRGGATCSENLAPLCRRHHRLKTHHGQWTYTVLEPGTYLWRSPHGYRFLRDHTGTRDTTPAEHLRVSRPASSSPAASG